METVRPIEDWIPGARERRELTEAAIAFAEDDTDANCERYENARKAYAAARQQFYRDRDELMGVVQKLRKASR